MLLAFSVDSLSGGNGSDVKDGDDAGALLQHVHGAVHAQYDGTNDLSAARGGEQLVGDVS